MRKSVLNFVFFVLQFLGFTALFASFWVVREFGEISFSQVLFHARIPVLDYDTPLVASFLYSVFVPSLLLGFFSNLVLAKLSKAFKASWGGLLALALVLCAFGVNLGVASANLKVGEFLASQKEFGSLYERHYKFFDKTALDGVKPTQNLIVIIAESFESTLSSQSIPPLSEAKNLPPRVSLSEFYAPFGELLPRLSTLAKTHTNFSPTSVLGGVKQVFGTSYTIAGAVGAFCGVPLNAHLRFNFLDSLTDSKPYFGGAVCVSDVLGALGYKQIYYAGTNSDFGGTRELFTTHGVEVRDLKVLQQLGRLPEPLPKRLSGAWGLKDGELLDLVAGELASQELPQPFAIFVSTIDTHFPRGYVDEVRCKGVRAGLEGAYLCADKLIAEFVEFVQNSPFGANTTIIIFGDHLSMAQNFVPNEANREVFNLFINPRFELSAQELLKLSKNRTLSHFDLAPLILNSVGLNVTALGFGRNPLRQKTLLEEAFSVPEFDAELAKTSHIYNALRQKRRQNGL